MIENNLGLIEMAFTFGVLVIFIVWQFISLNRDNKKAAAEKQARANKAAATTNTKLGGETSGT